MLHIYQDDVIVFLGDSLTAGNSGVSNPDQNPFYWQKIGYTIRAFYTTSTGVAGSNQKYSGISTYYNGPYMYNSGLAGDTIEGNPTTQFAARCGNLDPTVVITNLGTNDSIAALTTPTYTANVNALLAKLTGASNFKSGLAPKDQLWVSPEYNAVSQADTVNGNTVISARCAANNVNFYDVTVPWLAAGHTIPDAGEFTWDGRHFKQAGADFVSGQVLANAITLHQGKRP
jgi:lysophospholipase L1-like esterase